MDRTRAYMTLKKVSVALAFGLMAMFWSNRAVVQDVGNPSLVHELQEDNIREAVFRYQFEHNESGHKKKANVYCLSIEKERDPSEAFIWRFNGHTPPVKKNSECALTNSLGTMKDPVGIVIDKSTRKSGIHFGIQRIEWKNSKEVEVRGGYFENSLSASINIYYVVPKYGGWLVKKSKLLSIS
jgi:hypothetical protein